MKFRVKITKNHLALCEENGQRLFRNTLNEWKTIDNFLTPIASAFETEVGWKEIEASDKDEAIEILRRRKLDEKLSNNEKVNIDDLLEMERIPATIENASRVLKWLNTQNWGMWVLPKFTVPYIAYQYDCDGKIISTLYFCKDIEGQGKMFKSGNKRGHLEKYKKI